MQKDGREKRKQVQIARYDAPVSDELIEVPVTQRLLE